MLIVIWKRILSICRINYLPKLMYQNFFGHFGSLVPFCTVVMVQTWYRETFYHSINSAVNGVNGWSQVRYYRLLFNNMHSQMLSVWIVRNSEFLCHQGAIYTLLMLVSARVHLWSYFCSCCVYQLSV